MNLEIIIISSVRSKNVKGIFLEGYSYYKKQKIQYSFMIILTVTRNNICLLRNEIVVEIEIPIYFLFITLL